MNLNMSRCPNKEYSSMVSPKIAQICRKLKVEEIKELMGVSRLRIFRHLNITHLAVKQIKMK